MATIKFLLQSKSEHSNIYVQYSIARKKVLKRKTGFVINSKNWSVSKGCPILKDEHTKNLKIDLDSLKTKLEIAYNNAVKNGIEITGEWLSEQIDIINNKVPVVELDLLTNYINHIIDNAATRKNQKGGHGLSKNRIKVYQTFHTIILRYEKVLRKKIYLRNIDLRFVRKFTDWLLSDGYAINTIGKFIANIKTVCNDAQLNGFEVSPQLPLIKVINEKKESEEIIYLTFEELEKIEKTLLAKESLVNARRWLILGCYIGQRGSDLLAVTPKNIKQLNGMKALEIEQQKTGKNIAIPLLPKALDIVDNSFPYKIAIQNFNSYIKEICKIAGITTPTSGKIIDIKTNRKVKGIYPKYQLVSSHVCRRSFASNFYGDIPTSVLMGITGHGTESMFLKYIGKSSYDNAYQMVEYFSKMQERAKKPHLSVVKKAL